MRINSQGIIGGVLWLLGGLTGAAQDDALVRRGREVYLAEGCIHCHSQYVRPGSVDELRWGPGHPLQKVAADQPPLYGNRRQGPDLENIGARRSAEWLRLHLQSPRAFTPGSRMPSYAWLFDPVGNGDGSALVAYLDSLGRGAQLEILTEASQWQPNRGLPAPEVGPRQLFQENCAACHGPAGRGDGPLAGRLSRPPRDLTRADWIFFPHTLRREEEWRALARMIKFGQPGSTMAGHEYLTDAEVGALADYVQSLRTAP